MSPAAFTVLETERLRLRRFEEADLAAFLAYRNDPDVARYQSWEEISEEEAQAFLHDQQEAWPFVTSGGIQIAIELKETGTLIGDCYFTFHEDDAQQAEIGYTLARAYQGQGYAMEAVSCVLSYAFGAFDLHRITAVVDCENAASVALLERLRLRREGHFIQNVWFKGKWADEYLYAILREEWLIAHAAE